MSTKSNDQERLEEELKLLRKEVNEQGKRISIAEIRLTLAQAWSQFQMKAYDALLHYGINYRDLKEVQEDDDLTEAADMPISKARSVILDYLKRGESAIRAAIRRKQFKVH